MVSDTTRTVWFIMIDHPLQGLIRVGPAYATRDTARSWRSFVKQAWNGLPTRLELCKLRSVDGVMDAESRRRLSDRYNMDTVNHQAAEAAGVDDE